MNEGAFYFFTDNEIQYPDGPHFSKMFYTTAIGMVSWRFSFFFATSFLLF